MKRRLHSKAPEYNEVRNNFGWQDHILRLLVTASAIAWLKPDTVLDPACGDATIVEHAHRLQPIKKAYLGDISGPQIAALAGRHFDFQLEAWTGDAFEFFDFHPTADVVVLTEILEHVEEPEALLRLARAKAKYLVASSPLDEKNKDNHEHLWGWDHDSYRQMLVDTRWRPTVYIPINFADYSYRFQLWVCE